MLSDHWKTIKLAPWQNNSDTFQPLKMVAVCSIWMVLARGWLLEWGVSCDIWSTFFPSCSFWPMGRGVYSYVKGHFGPQPKSQGYIKFPKIELLVLCLKKTEPLSHCWPSKWDSCRPHAQKTGPSPKFYTLTPLLNAKLFRFGLLRNEFPVYFIFMFHFFYNFFSPVLVKLLALKME